MRGLRAQFFLLSVLWCFVPLQVGAADIQVTAALEPATFGQDQAARFVLTVTGSGGAAKPDMPVVQGLQFTYQGQSSKTSWINGTTSSSLSYNFSVQAEKTGKYTVPPVKVTVQGKEYTTEPVQCTVLPAQGSAVGTGAAGSGKDVAKSIGFMQVTPETERMYSGQVVPFTLKAYFRPDKQITLKSIPRLSREDFLLQSLDKEPYQQKERLDGTLYNSLTWQGTLSAVKEGSFPLTVEMDAEVVVHSRSRFQGSPFGSSFLNDPFFSDILGNSFRRDIKIISQEQEIKVLDLPTENRPDGFSGAIGTFALTVDASPLDGKVGDPITVKMQLQGRGNFSLIQAPVVTQKQGWKIYPTSGTVKELGKGKAAKLFEQALVPTEQGLSAVPPMQFSYFDPQAQKYVTLTSDPIPLNLQALANEPAFQPQKNQVPAEQRNQQEDKRDGSQANLPALEPPHLAPLQPELGKLVPYIQPLYQKLWFQGMIILALFCLLLALILFYKQRRLIRDPSILRRKEVQRRLNEHYEGMKRAIAVQDQELFHQHCRTAIQQRAGEVWGLAPEAVTLADVEQRLPVAAPLRRVFTSLEQSGYAGEQLTQAELEEIFQTTRSELDTLS
ncbi:MAG: protein BatD [Candidatus Electrothrix sp. AUS3]|nr:protein BatD [Candidatus Electrothrix gigas]